MAKSKSATSKPLKPSVWRVADSEGTVRELNRDDHDEEQLGIWLEQTIEFFTPNWTWAQLEKHRVQNEKQLAHAERQEEYLRLVSMIEAALLRRTAAKTPDVERATPVAPNPFATRQQREAAIKRGKQAHPDVAAWMGVDYSDVRAWVRDGRGAKKFELKRGGLSEKVLTIEKHLHPYSTA